MEEAQALARHLGMDLGMDVPQRIQGMRRLVGVKSSMLQDVEAGKPVELDALVSAVRELGQLAHVATPFTDALLGLARLQARVRGLY